MLRKTPPFHVCVHVYIVEWKCPVWLAHGSSAIWFPLKYYNNC